MSKTRPTMHDVAKEAGVSLKTVSRVVNNEDHINEATRARVNEAIAMLGFRRNDLARLLRQGQASHTIGLVIEDIANPFYSGITRGVEEIARQRHYMVIIGSNEKQSAQERDLVAALLRRRVEGLLLVPASYDQSYLLEERERGTPIIFLDRLPQHIEADAVTLDNRGGAKAGVIHLLERGHRRIGFIGGDPLVHTGAERTAGYRDALQEWHVPIDTELVRLGRHDAAQAEQACYELLALPDPPTAIFADNNRMTVGVLRALRMHDLIIDVTGFDDVELADMLPFPITLITHDIVEMGRIASRILFARLDGDDSPPQHHILPARMIVRGEA